MKTTTKRRIGILKEGTARIAILLVINFFVNGCLYAVINTPLNDNHLLDVTIQHEPDSTTQLPGYLIIEMDPEIELEAWMLSVEAFLSETDNTNMQNSANIVEEESEIKIEPWMLSVQAFLSDSKYDEHLPAVKTMQEILMVDEEPELEIEPWMFDFNINYWSIDLFAEEDEIEFLIENMVNYARNIK